MENPSFYSSNIPSFLLLLLLIICCCKNNSRSADIPIGFYGPLSGNMASFGTTVLRGIRLAVDEINAKGVNGKRLRLFVEDDRGNPEEAQSAVSRLITRDRVVAVLGDPSSSCSLAGASVCQQYKVPMITPTATNVKVTQQGKFIFRVCWIDPFQGEIMGRFAVENLKARNLAVLYDVASDYSTGLAEVFTKTIEKYGSKMVARESFSAGDTNFSAQLTRIRHATPDALFLPVYYNETGLIMRQLRASGSKMIVLGSDGWDSPQLWSIGGDALNGSYYCTHFLPTDPAPVVQQFVAVFHKRHRGEPSMGEALGYDAVKLLIDAMKRSSFDDPEKIRSSVASTKNFQGVTGNITIDESRNALKPAMLVKIENQKPILFMKMEPAR
jgi:branched-chain amino acid transport system substrate-binding protein